MVATRFHESWHFVTTTIGMLNTCNVIVVVVVVIADVILFCLLLLLLSLLSTLQCCWMVIIFSWTQPCISKISTLMLSLLELLSLLFCWTPPPMICSTHTTNFLCKIAVNKSGFLSIIILTSTSQTAILQVVPT